MFGSFLPGLGWLAPPKSIRVREPTLLWNQLHSLTRIGVATIFNECIAAFALLRLSLRTSAKDSLTSLRVSSNKRHSRDFFDDFRACPAFFFETAIWFLDNPNWLRNDSSNLPSPLGRHQALPTGCPDEHLAVTMGLSRRSGISCSD